MDEAIQMWCSDSLKLIQRSTKSTHESLDAEWFVEAAAFTCLAKSRGLSIPDAIEVPACRKKFSDELINEIVGTCPLDKTSQVETLGSIHEYLVAQRGGTATRRRSASRKTGGIFYTPQHVVDYIVNRTTDCRLEDATPDQLQSLRILDPAAGCGAFLLTAYRKLLKWHLNWYVSHEPKDWPADVVQIAGCWMLTSQRRQSILVNNLFGVDLDPAAIDVAQRTLWLELMDGSAEWANPTAFIEFDWSRLETNLKQGHALIGPVFGQADFSRESGAPATVFQWETEFPQVAAQCGFDIIVGNPPYRREKNYKKELDEIASTPLGRFRSPRMDLWYYFVHRGIELLRDRGMLCFITNAYWINGTGAGKLIATLKDDVHLDELFLLKNQSVFPGVSGQHSIFALTKSHDDAPIAIKVLSSAGAVPDDEFVISSASVHSYFKNREDLFSDAGINVLPPADRLLLKLNSWPRLKTLGVVRQGIAENPATINRRTLERFVNDPASSNWVLGEGVFSLQASEVTRLGFAQSETDLLRPYHDLCDLGRYWLAKIPSRQLIYSTRVTCPSVEKLPSLRRHLERFRPILEARRETLSGSNCWWHLHWPRDERLWKSQKLVALQMAARPSLVPSFEPAYVSFSTNVFIPDPDTREDLRYLCGILNSRVLWAWFEHNAKHRGVGLEINGNVLEQAPIRTIDFDNPDEVRLHDEITQLVGNRIELQRLLVEQQSVVGNDLSINIESQIEATESMIDRHVASLFELDDEDLDLVNEMT